MENISAEKRTAKNLLEKKYKKVKSIDLTHQEGKLISVSFEALIKRKYVHLRESIAYQEDNMVILK
jgi:hypothetical protein